ncbi:DoxX family membrane protein [Actinomadura rubrobrunea]|nr:DoxX family membrane protein [Actinomadura rubrobrunea]
MTDSSDHPWSTMEGSHGMRIRPVYDIVALLARLGVGSVFIAHGWQKIEAGTAATGRSFEQLGVPAPSAAAIYATFAELLGGLALIVGVGLPIAGTALFLDMAGAFVFVHARNGLFLVDEGKAENGFELVLVLGLASLLFAAGGGGRLSLDHRLFPPLAGRGGEEATPPEPDESRALRSGSTGGATTADTSRSDTSGEAKRRRRAAGGGDGEATASGAEAADAPDVPAPTRGKQKGGRIRRKTTKAKAEETAPDEESSTAADASPEAPSEGATGGKSRGTPRLAAEIISDTSNDVRVAGKGKRSQS